jgi:hypothetical protein
MKLIEPIALGKLACWLGVFADAGATLALLFPARMLSVPELYLSSATRGSLGVGAALILGWTFLLVWTSAKPVERRGLLLITMAAVIPGLAISLGYGLRCGYIPFRTAVAMWCTQSLLLIVMGAAYGAARREVAAEHG